MLLFCSSLYGQNHNSRFVSHSQIDILEYFDEDGTIVYNGFNSDWKFQLQIYTNTHELMMILQKGSENRIYNLEIISIFLTDNSGKLSVLSNNASGFNIITPDIWFKIINENVINITFDSRPNCIIPAGIVKMQRLKRSN